MEGNLASVTGEEINETSGVAVALSATWNYQNRTSDEEANL